MFGVPCVRLLSDDEDWDSESRRRSSTQGSSSKAAWYVETQDVSDSASYRFLQFDVNDLWKLVSCKGSEGLIFEYICGWQEQSGEPSGVQYG